MFCIVFRQEKPLQDIEWAGKQQQKQDGKLGEPERVA
jgi:hypothetical protein